MKLPSERGLIWSTSLRLSLLRFLAKKVFKGHCKRLPVSKLLSWLRASFYLILPTEHLIHHFNNNPLPLPPLPSWLFFPSFVAELSSLPVWTCLWCQMPALELYFLYPWWWVKNKLLWSDLNFNPFKWCMLYYYAGDFPTPTPSTFRSLKSWIIKELTCLFFSSSLFLFFLFKNLFCLAKFK